MPSIKHHEMVRALVKPGQDILDSLTATDASLLHIAACIPCEGGELFDGIKKAVIYRKPLDRANIVEELGDLEFYMEALRQILDISREETLAANIDKLGERYKKFQYSDKAAQERADKSSIGSKIAEQVDIKTGFEWADELTDRYITNWNGFQRRIDNKTLHPGQRMTKYEFDQRAVYCTQVPRGFDPKSDDPRNLPPKKEPMVIPNSEPGLVTSGDGGTDGKNWERAINADIREGRIPQSEFPSVCKHGKPLSIECLECQSADMGHGNQRPEFDKE